MVVRNHEDKDASFFIKLDRVESTRNPFRNRNYVGPLTDDLATVQAEVAAINQQIRQEQSRIDGTRLMVVSTDPAAYNDLRNLEMEGKPIPEVEQVRQPHREKIVELHARLPALSQRAAEIEQAMVKA